MKKPLLWLGFLAALVFLILTVVNASWLAEPPRGGVKLIGHRGIDQHVDRADLAADDCFAARIDTPLHDYIPNTGLSAIRASELGIRMIEIDLRQTADGKLVVFGDDTLDCRTDGTGPISGKTAEEIRELDAGYGYTADGGKSFPLRGKGVGFIRPISDFLRSVPSNSRAMFHFGSNNPKEADMLAARLKEFDRDPAKGLDGFFGPPEPVARMKQLYPDAWAFNPDAARQCASDYILTGWYGSVPESCNDGTMIIPVDEQWKFWGWPDRLIDRVTPTNTQIIVTGPESPSENMTGLTLPEQLGDVPSTFNGYIWVDDAWIVGPALFPESDTRREFQIEAAAVALEKRRSH